MLTINIPPKVSGAYHPSSAGTTTLRFNTLMTLVVGSAVRVYNGPFTVQLTAIFCLFKIAARERALPLSGQLLGHAIYTFFVLRAKLFHYQKLRSAWKEMQLRLEGSVCMCTCLKSPIIKLKIWSEGGLSPGKPVSNSYGGPISEHVSVTDHAVDAPLCIGRGSAGSCRLSRGRSAAAAARAASLLFHAQCGRGGAIGGDGGGRSPIGGVTPPLTCGSPRPLGMAERRVSSGDGARRRAAEQMASSTFAVAENDLN